MSDNLLNSMKELIEKNGESVFGDPGRAAVLFSELAASASGPEKDALVKCLERGFAKTLTESGEAGRADCVKRLAQTLREEEGIESGPAGASVNLLASALFGQAAEDEVEFIPGGSGDDDAETLVRNAEQGDAEAQHELGNRYYNGKGVSQNYEEAARWYAMAAEQGHAVAQYKLGFCYYKGQGVSQDAGKAMNWYSKAAKQGNAWAQYNLGFCYYKGEGVSQNFSKAADWFTKSAEQGFALAQFSLGNCYNVGQGVSQDYSSAKYWYNLAAKQGFTLAKGALQGVRIKSFFSGLFGFFKK